MLIVFYQYMSYTLDTKGKTKMKQLKNRFGFFTTTLIFAIFTIFGSFAFKPVQVNAAPFTCEPAFYQAIVGQLKKLNPQTGNYTTIGATAFYLNAIGFNVEDNYIYGLNNDPGGSTLVKVEDDGTYTDLGAVTGLPAGGSVIGDFDHSGNLLVLSSGTSIYSIDVSSVTATEITLSASVSGINDFAYINGHLYGTNGTSLYDITVSDGTVTTKSLGLASAVYGAAWSTVNDQLYVGQNTNGIIYQITGYTTGSPQATPVLQGDDGLIGNDGASCSLAPTVIIPVTAGNDTATTDMNTELSVQANNGLLQNDSPESVTVTSYTQPTNGTVTVNEDGSYTYKPNTDFSGTDSFTYTITDSVGTTASATVTITVAYVAPVQVPGPPDSGSKNISSSLVIISAVTSMTLVLGIVLRKRLKFFKR